MKTPGIVNSAVGPLVVGIGYYLTASLALSFTQGGNGIATIWPASGILLAALLLVPFKKFARYATAAAIGSLVANLEADVPSTTAFGFTVANIVESSLAASVLRLTPGFRLSFVQPAALGRFFAAAVLACGCSAIVATLAAPMQTADFATSWFTTDLLGILVVTPIIVIATKIWQRRYLMEVRRRVRESVLIAMLLIIVATITFAQSDYPLLFVPMLTLLIAVLRLGTFGAAISVFIIAIISAIATGLGTGPINLIAGDKMTGILFLQFYLLALLASGLPTAALLSAKDRLTASLGEQNRLLQMAERAAGIGHWRVDGATQKVFWSDAVFAIHGLEIGTPPSLAGAITAYLPEDRPVVEAAVETALTMLESFEFTARIARPDGMIRHLSCRGAVSLAQDSAAADLFGVVQDVTEQIESNRLLEEARQLAEAAAKSATEKSETDELTGLPNRRRVLALIGKSIISADANDTELTIVMVDVDHFKKVNDTFGHAIGDEVLREVAHNASAVLRSGDVIGRIGGEEFVIILPGASIDRAISVAERVRSAVNIKSTKESVPRISASCGVATWMRGEDASQVLRRADEALYAAKAAGRNTVSIAA